MSDLSSLVIPDEALCSDGLIEEEDVNCLWFRSVILTICSVLCVSCNYIRSADPVNIRISTSDSLAVTQLITSAGGTMSAKAADGTEFTLAVPSGALQESQQLTLTPASKVEGLPFSGRVAGVIQMSPEGLRFFQPAKLTIRSRDTVAAKGYETVAFGYHESGDGIYLTDASVKNGSLELDVWHFSGIGAAQATPSEISTQQRDHLPSSAEDAFTQRMREYLGKERQAQLLGTGEPDPEFDRTMRDFKREAFDRFIGPELPKALEDCEKGRSILSKALGWSRQIQLLGSANEANEFQPEIDAINKTVRNYKIKCGTGFIVDQSNGPVRLSGSICSLELPFTIHEEVGAIQNGTYSFTPSNRTSGTFTLEAQIPPYVTQRAAGTYTVEEPPDGNPKIILTGSPVSYSAPVIPASGYGGNASGSLELQPSSERCGR